MGYQGTWVWTADHDLDGDGITQLSLFSGRGILSESAGPVWMIGTASEHHAMYQYSLQGAKNHYMGLIQSETVSAYDHPQQTVSSYHIPPDSPIINPRPLLLVPSTPVALTETQLSLQTSLPRGVSMSRKARTS